MGTKLRTRVYFSPCGSLLLGEAGRGLCLCDWLDAGPAHARAVDAALRAFGAEAIEPDGCSELLDAAAAALDGYFAGRLRRFDLPLAPAGGSDFRRAVWRSLSYIPYGSVATYADIARAIGRPEAVRAVASAIGANPLSVFVPCHRVIGRDGSLAGYRGGSAAKSALLAMEAEATGVFAQPKCGREC